MKIVTVDQMRRLEEACPPLGISTDDLMEQAGLAVARFAQSLLGHTAGRRVVVLVGPGNNGGDGLVAARHLQRWGAAVTAYLVPSRPDHDPKLRLALAEGVPVCASTDDPDLQRLGYELDRCSLAIDSVLGTGRARPLEGVLQQAMSLLQSSRQRSSSSMQLLALDLPTGLDADSGQVDPACPQADVTAALGYPKIGHLRFPGAEKVGRLQVLDIGIPGHLADDLPLDLLTAEAIARHLPHRPMDSHKGTFGHALVVGGSRNFVGAAYMASQAAARVGAGLVTVAAPEGIYPMLGAKLTEVIHLPLPQDGDGSLGPRAASPLREILHRYDAMAVGCGMSRGEGGMQLLRELLLDEPPAPLPVLIDADGLNNLSSVPSWWQKLRGPAVLTPHPGEMATLTGLGTSDVQADRVGVASRYASVWGVTVVLKGAYTVIADRSGHSYLSPFANPGLASGGTGDVLSGIIVGLMAQGSSATDAALSGVYLHGLVGEEVRRELGEAGMLAGDLLLRLPRVLHQLRGSR